MNFKWIANESQLHIGIDRLSNKKFYTRSEKEKLDELNSQLAALSTQKDRIRAEFAKFSKPQMNEDFNESVALKSLLAELRFNNTEKKQRIKATLGFKKETLRVREQMHMTCMSFLSTQNEQNCDTFALIDRNINMELITQENLEYIFKRLRSDVNIISSKIKSLLISESEQNSNLDKIIRTKNKALFHKVYSTGLLQSEACEIDYMLNQHKDLVSNRKRIMESQKYEIGRLESECALLALKMEEMSAQSFNQKLALKKTENSKRISVAIETKTIFVQQVQIAIQNILNFLLTKNVSILKEQLLHCIRRLIRSPTLNDSGRAILSSLEQELNAQQSHKLEKQVSLGQRLDEQIDEFNSNEQKSSVTFVPAFSVNSSKNTLRDISNFRKVSSLNEMIFGLPLHLMVMLMSEYFVKLNDGCDKFHAFFADLHKRWTIRKKLLRDTERFLDELRQSRSADQKNKEPYDEDINYLPSKTGKKIEEMVTKLETHFELIFQVKVFIKNFAQKIHKVIYRINQVCPKLNFNYQLHLLCPFYFEEKVADIFNPSRARGSKFHNLVLSVMAKKNLESSAETQMWAWLKHRLPMLRLFKCEKSDSLDTSHELITLKKSNNNQGSAYKKLYEMISNEMHEFVVYVQHFIREFEEQKQNSIRQPDETYRSKGNSVIYRSTVNLNSFKNQQNENDFGSGKGQKSFQEKILMQN